MIVCIFFTGKEVVKRWTNLRDCFAKSKKDDKSAKKSGSGAKKRKKYVFSDQLQFLNKIYTEKETVDSFNLEGTLEEDEEPEGTTGEPEVSTNVNLPSKPVGTRKRKKLDEVEVKMLKALEHKTPCSKMSFLQSLMPHLTNYSNSEFLQFQVGVLNVIENINKLKETPHLQSNNPSSVPSYQPQPQYMLQPSPVNQPQAFVHVQQPPFQPQQYANPSFSGYVQNSAQQLHFSQYVREQQNQSRPTQQSTPKQSDSQSELDKASASQYLQGFSYSDSTATETEHSPSISASRDSSMSDIF